MSTLTIGEAAALLHTAPSTIRSWEQRLGYPTPVRSTSGRRLYDECEIAILSDALRRGLSISSAIRQVREETGSHEALLRQALSELDFATCDALLEAAIAMRGVSRAFDETVLTAVEGVVLGDDDAGIAALAVEWAKERACWGCRHVIAPLRGTILVVDGSSEGSVTRAASCILALQLTLRSMRTLMLAGPARSRYGGLARRLDTDAIVFVGEPAPSAGRANALVPSRIAGFRTAGERLHPGMETLPVQPRLAAHQLVGPPARDIVNTHA